MKLLLLSNILNLFIQITEPGSIEQIGHTLQQDETVWVAGELSDSYENQILMDIGQEPHGKSIEEYRKIFWELGLNLEHLEIKREMAEFNGLDALKKWVLTQVKDELLVETYLAAMQQKGWLDLGDGMIRFPRQQLIACLKLRE